jgi:hypothetical protein
MTPALERFPHGLSSTRLLIPFFKSIDIDAKTRPS